MVQGVKNVNVSSTDNAFVIFLLNINTFVKCNTNFFTFSFTSLLPECSAQCEQYPTSSLFIQCLLEFVMIEMNSSSVQWLIGGGAVHSADTYKTDQMCLSRPMT